MTAPTTEPLTITLPSGVTHISIQFAEPDETPAAMPDEARGVNEQQVRDFYADCHGKHRKLLKHLASKPDAWTRSDELAVELKDMLDNGELSLRSLFASLGKRANHHGGFKPFISQQAGSARKRKYRMNADTAKIIAAL